MSNNILHSSEEQSAVSCTLYNIKLTCILWYEDVGRLYTDIMPKDIMPNDINPKDINPNDIISNDISTNMT